MEFSASSKIHQRSVCFSINILLQEPDGLQTPELITVAPLTATFNHVEAMTRQQVMS